MREPFGRGKRAEELIRLVHYVGAFRHIDMRLLCEGCDDKESLRAEQRLWQQTERRLRAKGVLEKLRIRNAWYVKRTRREVPEPYAGAACDCRLAMRYFYSNGNSHTNQATRARRLSQTVMFSLGALCKAYPDEKPRANGGYAGVNMYYHPREIAGEFGGETLGQRASRATGIVVGRNSEYALYTTGSRDYAFSDEAEMRFSMLAGHIALGLKERPGIATAIKGALVIAEDVAVMQRLVGNMDELSVYERVLVVPLSFFGQLLTRLILNHGDILTGGIVELTGITTSAVDCDCVTGDGRFILQMFMPDAVRLRRFASAAANGEKGKYEVLCFEEQAASLEFLLDRNISLKVFDFDYKELMAWQAL